MRTQSILRTVCLTLIVMACLSGVQFAQDVAELKASQKSVILFDFRISKWLKEARAAKLDISKAEAFFESGPFIGFKPSQIERIYGSASFPKKFSEVMALRQGVSNELPFDIFVQVRFDTAQSAAKFEASVREYSKVVELGGKKFLQSKDIGPENFVCHRYDELTFEFGTSSYCQQDSRVFLTDRLKQIYRTVPDQSLRIAVDLETPSEFVEEVVGLATEQITDPIVTAYLELVGKANSITGAHSLSADNLLTLRVDSQDDEASKEVTAGLESALATLKLLRGSSFGLPANTDATSVVEELLGSLVAIQDGSSCKIEVPRPKKFFAAVNQLQSLAAANAARAVRMNRFRQVAMACLNFEAALHELPFNYDKNTHETLSWRVKVLPFVDELKMHQAIDLKAGPQGSANSKFATKMPGVFGEGGVLSTVCWIQSTAKGLADITDGTSKTVMLIETPKGRPWLEANPVTVDQAIEMVVGLPEGEELAVVFYDGSVRTVDNSIDKKLLRWLFEPADGNKIPEF